MDAGSTNWLGEFPSKLSYTVLVETGSCAFRMEISFIHGTMVFLLFAAALDMERMVYHNETSLHTTTKIVEWRSHQYILSVGNVISRGKTSFP